MLTVNLHYTLHWSHQLTLWDYLHPVPKEEK